MPTLTFREFNGTEHLLDIPNGEPLMQAALQAGIEGIEAQCGGNGVCATCHVFVECDDFDRLQEVDENEEEMLNCTSEPRQCNSRLSCQLLMSEELAGSIIQLPATQS